MAIMSQSAGLRTGIALATWISFLERAVAKVPSLPLDLQAKVPPPGVEPGFTA
jgi:hypothetical protein